jgi:hypothetical protein
MNTTAMRTGAALACTAVLALAACGSDDDDTAASGSPQETTAASTGASPTGSAGTTAPPSGDAPPPGGGGGNGSVDDGARCHTSELTVTAGRGDGAAGSVYHPLIFRNSGDRTCTVAGFPGVSMVGDNNGTQVGAPADRDAGTADPVTLGPGQSATATLRVVNVQNYGDQCSETPADGLRIYPPDELDALYLQMPGLTGCSNDDIVAMHIGPLTPA